MALLVTFAASGFLFHDLPVALIRGKFDPQPFVTSWFVIIGTCILVADHYRLDFRALRPRARALAHSSFLAATGYATFRILVAFG